MFLACQHSLEEGRGTSNGQSLFGAAKIPTDNHIRALLDPVRRHEPPGFRHATVHDRLESLWGKAREAKRASKHFFEHIRASCSGP